MDPIALAEAGPWAVVVAMMVGGGLGAVKGWWVPGFVWRQSEARADDLADKLDALIVAVDKLTRVRRGP